MGVGLMAILSTRRQNILRRLMRLRGPICWYCERGVRLILETERLPDDAATVDHVIPKSKGGQNYFDNYALACHKCNHAKADSHHPVVAPAVAEIERVFPGAKVVRVKL